MTFRDLYKISSIKSCYTILIISLDRFIDISVSHIAVSQMRTDALACYTDVLILSCVYYLTGMCLDFIL